MAGVKLREAMLGGKIKLGNKTYSVKEVRTSDGVVWPYEQYTYRVTGFSLKYSAGASLLATATNYAYIQATIAKINREGQVVETSTVDAAPTFVSGTNYYSVSNAHILFNKTKYGKSVIASRSTDKFSATCTTPDGIVWQSEEFSVSFAGNARTFNLISANVSLSLTESEISCITVENVARVQLSRTYYYSYTSQLRDDDVTDTGSSASIYLGDSYVGDIEHDHSLKLNVGTNVNTLIERDFGVKASYYSQNDSKSFTQGADHPTGDIATPVPGTYQVVISEVENTVSATGGKAILGVSAIHTENVVNKYYYGGEIISQKQRTADDGVSYAISGTDDAKSRYTSVSFVSARLSMVHSNMAKRSTGADNITVTFTNSSDSSATASKSFSPTNTKTETIGEKQYGTPTSTTTTGYQAYAASISANRYTSSSSPCPAYGGTATLSWSGSHQERTETKTSTPWNRYKLSSWASGSTQSDLYDSGTDVSWSYGSWTTKTDTLTPTSQGTSGFTRSGSTVTVDSENRTTYSSGRSCTYTVTNGSATKTVTIYQQANVKTTGTWTYQYALSCSDMSTVPATQTSRTMSATSTRSRTDTWTSGAQDTTTEDYSSSVSVSPSGAAMVPETFSGSGTFRCVIQANTGAQRSVTVSMGGKSVTFTQAAYVPPAVPTVTITAGSSGTGTRKTITIKASFADYSGSVSLSGVSIIYNRQGGAATTYNVSDTVTLSPSSDTYTSGLRIMGVSGDIFVVKISATSATPTSVTFKYIDKEIPF